MKTLFFLPLLLISAIAYSANDLNTLKIDQKLSLKLLNSVENYNNQISYLEVQQGQIGLEQAQSNEGTVRRLQLIKETAKEINNKFNPIDQQACVENYSGLKVCPSTSIELLQAVQDLNDHISFLKSQGIEDERITTNEAYIRKLSRVQSLKSKLVENP